LIAAHCIHKTMDHGPWATQPIDKKTYLCTAKRSIAPVQNGGGKSGQHRASCFLTGRRRQPATASATENKPLPIVRSGVRVKT
jgi:hypothetical protein